MERRECSRLVYNALSEICGVYGALPLGAENELRTQSLKMPINSTAPAATSVQAERSGTSLVSGEL